MAEPPRVGYTSQPIGTHFMNMSDPLFVLIGALVILSASSSAQWPDHQDPRAPRGPTARSI